MFIGASKISRYVTKLYTKAKELKSDENYGKTIDIAEVLKLLKKTLDSHLINKGWDDVGMSITRVRNNNKCV